MKTNYSFLLVFAAALLLSNSVLCQWKLLGNGGTDPTKNFVGTTDIKDLVFRTNKIERMRILASGNIGVGKSPQAFFNIAQKGIVSLSKPGSFLIGSTKGVNLAMDASNVQARNNGSAALLFLNAFGGNVQIGSAKSVVGIAGGTFSAYTLNINASSAAGGINITDPVDNPAIAFSKSGLNSGAEFSKTSTTSGVETIYSSNSGSGAAVSAYSVNGIGLYGSSQSFHGVYGFTSGAQSSGDYAGFFNGAVDATGGYYNTSDQNLKKNIEDISKAIDIIKQLRPKHYEFKSDGDYKLMKLPEGEHYGLIAQDVEKVLPELVGNARFETVLANPHPTEEDAKASKTIMFKTLNYTELIPILIKGMQEQQETIDKQQQQIDQLKQLVQSMINNTNPSSFSPSGNSTGAYLLQNAPNPFSQNTVIRYNIPSGIHDARLSIMNAEGKQAKVYSLQNRGLNTITINAGTLSAGAYSYSLIVDGKLVDSKTMVITR